MRPYSEVLMHGIFSLPSHVGLDNYLEAIQQMFIGKYFFNTAVILIPVVFVTLFFASAIAFVITKYDFKFNLPLLLLFTAGSLLPPQVIFLPIFKMYILIGSWLGNKSMLYDNYLGIILIHIALQTGFATFILNSYLRTIPKEISEQAQVDGASIFQHYFVIVLPMMKAPLLTLGILISTWVYNDFFWGFAMMKSDSLRPMSTALGRIGAFRQLIPDQGVLAAGSLIAALPLLILYLFLRKHFMSGIILGPVAKAK
ncbi:UgpE ABC-type sugar transport system, permease component [Candidatus Nanopelagicaceae bacterium]